MYCFIKLQTKLLILLFILAICSYTECKKVKSKIFEFRKTEDSITIKTIPNKNLYDEESYSDPIDVEKVIKAVENKADLATLNIEGKLNFGDYRMTELFTAIFNKKNFKKIVFMDTNIKTLIKFREMYEKQDKRSFLISFVYEKEIPEDHATVIKKFYQIPEINIELKLKNKIITKENFLKTYTRRRFIK